MIVIHRLLLLLILLMSHKVWSQSITGVTGAKAWMMGGASAAETDVWSVNNNPGAMGFMGNSQLGIYTEQRFRESRLKLANLSGTVKTKYLHVGGVINYYGYEVFNQQKLGLSVGKQLSSMIAIGVQLNYLGTTIQEYGSGHAFAIGAGLLVKPVENMRLGVTVFNPTQNRFSQNLADKIPTYARYALSYDVSKKVLIQVEGDQTLEQKLALKAGINYQLHDVISLAAGAASNPVYYTFGTSLCLKQFKLDMASSFHEVLGFSPHVAIALPVLKN